MTEGTDVHPVPCPSHWRYPAQAFDGVTVLAISSQEAEHRALKGLFDHTKWVLNQASTLQTALEQLDREPVPVILASEVLSDGDWTNLLERIPETPDAPRVIVVTHKMTPELYESVMRHGAFDILSFPFESSQLYEAVSDAWRQWKCAAGRTMTAFA